MLRIFNKPVNFFQLKIHGFNLCAVIINKILAGFLSGLLIYSTILKLFNLNILPSYLNTTAGMNLQDNLSVSCAWLCFLLMKIKTAPFKTSIFNAEVTMLLRLSKPLRMPVGWRCKYYLQDAAKCSIP